MEIAAKPRATGLAIAAALLSVYVIWGSTYLAIRIAIETLPPFLFAGVRFVFAGLLLYLWRRALGDRITSAVQWRSAAIAGLFMLVGGNGSVVWAEQRVASGLASLLVATVPLWMVLVDWLRPGGRWPRSLPLAGVLVGLAGIALLIGRNGFAGGGLVDPAGAAVLAGGALLWATGSIVSRGAEMPASPLLATSIEMLAGGAGLLFLAAFAGDPGRLNLAAVSARSLLACGYLVIFGSLIAFSAYAWLLRVAPTPLVSTYAYVNPVVAILLGHVLAGEPLTPRTFLAAAVILGSVVLITMPRRR